MNTTKEKFQKKALNYLAVKSCLRVSTMILLIFFILMTIEKSRQNPENIMTFGFLLLIANGFIVFMHAYPMSEKFIEDDLIEDTADYLLKRELRKQEANKKRTDTRVEELKNV